MSFLKESREIIQRRKEAAPAVERQEQETRRRPDEEYFSFIEKEAPVLLSQWRRLGLDAMVDEVHRTVWPSEYCDNGVLKLGGEGVVGFFMNRDWMWGKESASGIAWSQTSRQLRDVLLNAYQDVSEPFWQTEAYKPNPIIYGEVYTTESYRYPDDSEIYRAPLFTIEMDRNKVSMRIKGQLNASSFSIFNPHFKTKLEREIDSRIAKYLLQH